MTNRLQSWMDGFAVRTWLPCQGTNILAHFCTHMVDVLQSDVWKTDPEWFGPWFNTEAYHILYGHRSEKEAQDLVHALHRGGHLGAAGRALDAGCGAGRHARSLARLGWEVDAFDLSPLSIESARTTSNDLAGQLTFHVDDLRSLTERKSWKRAFNLTTNFFTSLGYFEGPDAQLGVVRGLAETLKPGGKLLLDFLNVHRVANHLVPFEKLTRGGMEFVIHRRIHGGWIEKSIQFEWKGKREHHVERVQAMTPEDLQNMIVSSGLKMQDLWGDYALNRWCDESPRTLMLAQRI